jgi:hypothetical protein
VRITASSKRGQLREIAWSSAESVPILSLYDGIKKFSRARFQTLANGHLAAEYRVEETSGNGSMVRFAAGTEGLTAEDFKELGEEFMTLYEQVQAALISTGTADPTDAAILVEMLSRLQDVKSYRTSFRCIREDYAFDEVLA